MNAHARKIRYQRYGVSSEGFYRCSPAQLPQVAKFTNEYSSRLLIKTWTFTEFHLYLYHVLTWVPAPLLSRALKLISPTSPAAEQPQHSKSPTLRMSGSPFCIIVSTPQRDITVCLLASCFPSPHNSSHGT